MSRETREGDMLHRLAPHLEDTRTSIHYFSQLRKRSVVDAVGEPVGMLVDLLASAPSSGQRRVGGLPGHPYLPPPAPLLLGLLVAATDGLLLCVQPTQVASGDGKQIHLRCRRETLSPYMVQPTIVRLATTVLNRDVIDQVKKRVVLINDLALDEDWHLLGLDGSPSGLLRWLLPHGVWEHVIPPSMGTLLPWGHVMLLPGDSAEGEAKPGRYSPAIRWQLGPWSPTELADLIQQLTPKEGSRILETLDATVAAATLAEFALPDQMLLFKQAECSCALRVLEAMEPGMAADLLAALPPHEAQHMLEQISAVRAAEVQCLLAYPHASAGRLMTTHALVLDSEDTVATAVGRVRRLLLEGHRIVEMAYVADSDEEEESPVVVGAVPLGELLAADPADQVQDLVHTPLVSVRPETDLHTVAECMYRARLQALPVLDAEGQLLGVIQLTDVLGRLLRLPQRRLHHLSRVTRIIS